METEIKTIVIDLIVGTIAVIIGLYIYGKFLNKASATS